MNDKHTCPRCGGGIPNDIYRGQYCGALSRLDNKTEICSACGEDEAMEEFFDGGIRDWRQDSSTATANL